MSKIDFQTILHEIETETAYLKQSGEVASYIPELAKVNPDHYGMHLRTVTGREFYTGDWNIPFSAQSISKVFSLAMAVSLTGEKIWERISVEPSGNPFNSIVQLEYEKGIPRNPFINAGALVLADILITLIKNPKEEFIEFVRLISGNPAADYDEQVVRSEKETGYLNAALINVLKYFGNIHNELNDVLDLYYHQCSVRMSCADLSHAFLPFANHRKPFSFNGYELTMSQVKRINALMQTCGFYDEAGEFSYLVGLPGKSGVGGGIVAFHPDIYTVAVWSPRLNKKGNSVMGMKALELLTTKAGISIF
ncbi:MAG: glutaminase [Ignavibacteriales bacterium]|nr:MAG: glutaminase [Ignavibacteriales bacterium]